MSDILSKASKQILNDPVLGESAKKLLSKKYNDISEAREDLKSFGKGIIEYQYSIGTAFPCPKCGGYVNKFWHEKCNNCGYPNEDGIRYLEYYYRNGVICVKHDISFPYHGECPRCARDEGDRDIKIKRFILVELLPWLCLVLAFLLVGFLMGFLKLK